MKTFIEDLKNRMFYKEKVINVDVIPRDEKNIFFFKIAEM